MKEIAKTALEMCLEITKAKPRVNIFPDVPPAIDPKDNRYIEYTDDGPRLRLDAPGDGTFPI